MANEVLRGPMPPEERKPVSRLGGRPKGFDGTRSRMPSALAQSFKKNGLDWKIDFASAIKAASDFSLPKASRNEAKERIKLWLRLLPYMITSSRRTKVKHWKGRPSKAAQIALEAMERGE